MAEHDSKSRVYQTNPLTDDQVLPFYAEIAGVNGRVVSLGSTIDAILTQHNYPEPVSKLLGEAIALTSMIGSALKFEGKLILQIQSDGPVDLVVVQFAAPGAVRGYARFDDEKVAVLPGNKAIDLKDILGKGHLAMTLDRGPDTDRYQGIVALEGKSLAEVAHQYFEQSEQLPSFLRLAVARHYIAGDGESSSSWQWRAGGLMIQDMTIEGGWSLNDDTNIDAEEIEQADEDGWNRALHLAGTVEDHELLDPLLAPEELIYRLFHEERVRVFDRKSVVNECNCSREHIKDVVMQFANNNIQDLAEDGRIVVTCEFCSTRYDYDPNEF